MKRFQRVFAKIQHAMGSLNELREIQLHEAMRKRIQEHPNPLCRYGALFGFSQTDEDGITLEIIRRIGIDKGTFCEFGVGTGRENNTLILLSKNWSGLWVGGQKLEFDPPSNGRLKFFKAWITKENIVELYNDNMNGESEIDVISLDLDGNDYYLVEEVLMEGIRPNLFIVEYNSKFPPSVDFKIDYDPNYEWQHDDYHGASLLSFVKLFEQFDYSLVCCNAATGVNAFFVQSKYRNLFEEVPVDIAQIYASPFYFIPMKKGHKKSIKTILKVIQ